MRPVSTEAAEQQSEAPAWKVAVVFALCFVLIAYGARGGASGWPGRALGARIASR
ncbi:hypothetical protein Rhow_000822 [Rhodococcus wratislaviensis]|uniref:Uncharacterized protein n=1 Tax=Rhodococcus wratislaviensis TaxID=44752 RepID=A0A402C2Z2_RHOWR|nr:hypothetical protein Rhow_000822 [Rhodococcus wratislaviensis]